MGTFTAQILVGRSDPFHGGIQPSHQLFLCENSVPSWILTPYEHRGGLETRQIWIPTLEDILMDGILMATLLALADPDLVTMAKSSGLESLLAAEQTGLYGLPQAELAQLRAACARRVFKEAIFVTFFEGSSALKHRSVLAELGSSVRTFLPT